ncbi:hypothetical protein GW7_09298 [Heterocephalus glaber]|uniref:Uncharacterized protein n=1 Tax=Heterocephalus glaber TaxID=10181 RepID=G5AYY9_HETGA|nr:hypothetical protein GW7_09298 [Heterocephalus glaber]
MDSCCTGEERKVAQQPGKPLLAEEGDLGGREAHAPSATPRLAAVERSRVPPASRRFIYKQCARLKEHPNCYPSGTPPRGAPAFGSPLQAGAGDAHLGVAPIPPVPARGSNSPGSPEWEGGSAHLVFRKSVDRLP